MNQYRLNFVLFWEGLSSKVKALLISIAAVSLALLFLMIARALFPSADLSKEEVIVLTGVSGLIASLAKDWFRGE